ncbi:ion channel [Pelagibius sp. 7325]|uniref:ion channel n=1 Tax=Pelagibius sp. 7325 TaxID=3131994 RepID=UPI0030EE70DF
MAEARLKKILRDLYTGRSQRATNFRYGLLAFDLATIAFFVVTAPEFPTPFILTVDFILGLIILADFLARLWIAPARLRMLRQLYTVADVLVILTLLLAPFFSTSFAFLRVLRAMRLLHSYHVLRDLREETDFFRRNEEVIVACVNLFVFIFLATALVFTLQYRRNPDIESYVDALYFTVTTLTTTGFGDITMTGSGGRLLAVGIMVIGVALFFRLAQAVVRPTKVRHACPTCGLDRHEPDAVHCKHCGETIRIPTHGVE